MEHTLTLHYAGCPARENPEARCDCKWRRYAGVLRITIAFFIAEMVCARLIGSTSLLADALHLFTDSVGFIIAGGIALMESRGGKTKTLEGLSFWIMILLLVGFVAFVIAEACERLAEPQLTNGLVVAALASIGFLMNVAQHRKLEEAPHAHRDRLHHANRIHVLGDLVLSAAVVVGGIMTFALQLTYIDPLVSLLSALWIGWLVVRLAAKGTAEHEHHHHH
jgi:cobalt-zinc-cadmium efflux system protein